MGILVSNDLKWTAQINSSISKANSILGMIRRTFKFQNKESICRLYKTFVKPHLEFEVSVWRPTLQDINSIESVQRRATKLIRELNKLDYKERPKKTNLLSLEAKRTKGLI